MPVPSKNYVDISLAFDAHPVTGDVATLTNEAAIRQSIMNIVKTHYGEKPFQPLFGSDAHAMLFENANPFLAETLARTIHIAIENHEPRVIVRDVEVAINEDANAFDVAISYEVISTGETYTFDTLLKRLR